MTTKARLAAPLLSMSRTYVRYAPWRAGKQRVFRFASDYLNHHGAPQFVATLNGSRMQCDPADLVQSHILYFGQWEPALTRYLTQTLHEGDVFVDVGANVGYFSLLAARIVGRAGRVVAIDASPVNYRELQNNLIVNRACRIVRSRNVAVMKERGTIPFYAGPKGNNAHASVIQDGDAAVEGLIDGFPLPELLTAEEWQKARVVKIDVEGAEGDVLAGLFAAESVLGPTTDVVVEITPDWLASRGYAASEILRRFAQMGYTAYQLAHSTGQYVDRPSGALLTRVQGVPTSQTDMVFSRDSSLDTRLHW